MAFKLQLREDRPATIEEHRALRAENERLLAALKASTTELENLFALVQGEAPSLLEDHFSYMDIVAAIKAGNDALTHEQAANTEKPHGN